MKAKGLKNTTVIHWCYPNSQNSGGAHLTWCMEYLMLGFQGTVDFNYWNFPNESRNRLNLWTVSSPEGQEVVKDPETNKVVNNSLPW